MNSSAPVPAIRWDLLAPWLFVMIWSTGFIGAAFVLPHTQPYTILAVRYVPVTLFFCAFALLLRCRPLRGRQWLDAALVAFFMQFGYFGGVFVAIEIGAGAGMAALIAGMQPILASLGAAAFLGERAPLRCWAGLGLGMVAVGLVVSEKLADGLGSPGGILMACVAMLSMTLGTLLQKRTGSEADPWVLNGFQNGMGCLYCLVAALLFEDFELVLHPHLIGGLAWLIFMSCVTLPLLFLMLKLDAVSRVNALFCLVPPLTASLAWLLFDEHLGVLGLTGFALAVVAVWLARS